MKQRDSGSQRGARTNLGGAWPVALAEGLPELLPRGAWRVAGALVALGGACVRVPGAWAITDAEEARMGQAMSTRIADSMGGALPLSDPMAQRVERIGRRFAHLARPRSFGYRYRVLRNASILNAFATPGGTIYITSRLVAFTRSEDELASILGHETAHVSQRHIAQELDDRNAFVRFGARLAQMRREAALSSAQGARRALRNGGQKTEAPRPQAASQGDMEAQARSASPATMLTYWMLSRGRSRALESEADAVSVRWMRRLGYDPRAAIRLLQHAAATMPASSSPLASLLASHPGTPERVVALRELIEREKLDIAPRAQPAQLKAPPAKAGAAAGPASKGTADSAPTTATSDVAAAASVGAAPPKSQSAAPAVPR